MVKRRSRLKAISLLLGDANLLWHELVLWQVCPIPMCPRRIEQLAASLPSYPLGSFQKDVLFEAHGSKSAEPVSGNLDSSAVPDSLVLPLVYL